MELATSTLPESARRWLDPRARAGEQRAQWFFLARIGLCAIPSMGLLALQRPQLAGYSLFAMLGAVLVYLGLRARPYELLAVVVAAGPLVNLLRQSAFYNIVLVMLLAAIIHLLAYRPAVGHHLWLHYRMLITLLIFNVTYYAISFYIIEYYAINLRMIEMALAAGSIIILSLKPTLLGYALLGRLLCACAVGGAMLPGLLSGAADRLGMIRIGDQLLGNPIQAGLPLAMGFLALTLDKAQWLNLQPKSLMRLGLLLVTTAMLALTTSRASWLVALGGLVLVFIFGKRQRLKVLLWVLLGAVALLGVLLSPYGESFRKGLDRTFSEDRSINSRTSGRTDQWLVSYVAFTDTAGSMIHGYGPGRGAEIYGRFSSNIASIKYQQGVEMDLHSLFMQLAVESGLLGLLLAIGWFIYGFFRVLQWSQRTRLLLPLACFLGFILVALTVTGSDTNSGTFLGIGLLATARGWKSQRPIPTP